MLIINKTLRNVTYDLRLKQCILDHIDGNTKDAVLMSKFWSGLKSSQLRIATRHKYNSVITYKIWLTLVQSLLKIKLKLTFKND